MIRCRWAIAVAVVTFPLLFAAPAVAMADDGCAAAGTVTAPDPWAQQMLAPQTAWTFTRGRGQTVAVLDSGVDATQPQLRGHVDPGYDAVTGAGSADSDCAGTGTAVAGAIVAAKSSPTSIYGIAPDARVVPVRVLGEPGADNSGTVPPDVLARGITWATGHGVDVIDVSVAITVDDAGVRSAVAGAVAAGITVIASVGDAGTGGGSSGTPYPAAYPGVIGVAAVDADGQVWTGSNHGSFVDLAAPGAGVPALARHHGVVQLDGTALAAGYVSGAAALVRSRWSVLSAVQIGERLLGTGSPIGAATFGVVNPYRAVTETTATKAPVRLPGLTPAKADPAALAQAAAQRHSRSIAIELTGIGLGALLLITVIAVGVPRARRRAWHATYAARIPDRLEPEEPAPLAPLFDDLSVI
jgi:membrane-anchored mycosin MYCP